MNRFKLNIDLKEITQSLKNDKSLKKQIMIIQSILNKYINYENEFAHYMDSNCYDLAVKNKLNMQFKKMDKSNDPYENSTYPTYCLTIKADSNVMWRLYTSNNAGVMQTLTIEEIDSISNRYPILFGPIFYMNDVDNIISLLKELELKYHVTKLVELFLNFCKHKEWEDESEYRMIYITEEEVVYIPSNSFGKLVLLGVDKKRETDSISKVHIETRRTT